MEILKFDNLSKFNTDIIHFVSQKDGFDKNKTESLNLSLFNAKKPEVVIAKRKKLAKKVGVSIEELVFAQQIHGDNVFIAKKDDCGSGVFKKESAIRNTDAFISKEKKVCIVILVADCVPILLFDKEKKVIAAVHAGWKGTLQEIVAKTIKKMKKDFHCKSENILAGMGPSIGSCHFEVKKDVFDKFRKAFGNYNEALMQGKKRMFIDLWELNKQQLLQAGLLEEKIEIMEKCTVCEDDKFFSARRGQKGRFVVGIVLK
ncbi:peptidoglycan editing factor PgeF [bacterium]|jgi:polyphenol oxidase|nr:peptidoglycan editing factor PgeF [bacterium]MBT4251568.1 peptidoglycan editing factor PgeF [bacterium]MBT4597617.1 peptidoglycan editing factor PgeF [bacterium]MBT6753631.1 peptidoglycan editing factor PgeF [bacterium]MBT7037768.1 peptidoglycan editing factor PgeF [bacterium]